MDHLEIRLREYVDGGARLLWRRIAMYCGASALVAFYFSVPISLVCIGLLLTTEAIDSFFVWLFRRAERPLRNKARQFYTYFFVSSVLSTFAVSGYAFIVAQEQGPGDHFMPMTFLLAAALFAAMNNHQIKEILFFRLVIYGITFLAIPAIDLIQLRPPLLSSSWLQMITAIFILYFVVDISMIFLRLYQDRLARLEELARENERANAALVEKNNLISVVSHELKTPLTVVSGALDILAMKLMRKGAQDVEHLLSRARQNTHRLHELVNDMLDLRALERGDFSLVLEEFDLAGLVTQVVDRRNAFEGRQRYHLETSSLPVPPRVRGDRARLERILENLASNAGKFSEGDQDVRIAIDQDADDRIRVAVTDKGIGLSQEAQEKIFGRFSQLDSRHNRAAGGLGLGLNLAREIILRHGGDITLESSPGLGSTFYLILPANAQSQKETTSSTSPALSS